MTPEKDPAGVIGPETLQILIVDGKEAALLPLNLEADLTSYCTRPDAVALIAMKVNTVLQKQCKTVEELNAVLTSVEESISAYCETLYMREGPDKIQAEAAKLTSNLFKDLVVLRSIHTISDKVEEKVEEVTS